MIERIAFLGTGLMGKPIAERLLAGGFAVRVWNRTPSKAQALAARGGTVLETVAEAVAGVQLVCLCLSDGAAIDELLFGFPNLAGSLPHGALLLDFSTIGPNATLLLTSRLKAERPDVGWIDAPVSGGVGGAEAGELIIMCGGEAADITAVEPVLSLIAKRTCHLGPLGAGQAAKMCNQLIVSVNIVAIAEAFALGRKLGLDIVALPSALAGGWADSRPLQVIGNRMANATVDPKIASIETFIKDLALVLDSADDAHPMARKAHEVLKKSAALNGGEADVSSIFVSNR